MRVVTTSRPLSWQPPVTASKLVPPALPPVAVERDGLLHRLGSARVTLVVAPPGYGKTVAVRQWLGTSGHPTAWMSVDLIDQRPQSFWLHFLAALRGALPTFDPELDLLLAERGVDEVFLGALVSAVIRHGQRVDVVLDGISHFDDPELLDGIALLVEQAGQVLRLVIVSRSRPELPIATWRSRGWVADVTQDRLRFSDADALALARAMDAGHRPQTVLALNERLEGWPIGVHVGLLSGVLGDGDGSGGELGTDRVLHDYLVGEVLDRLPADLRAVALGAAVPRWVDADICRALLGDHAATAVHELGRRGVFLEWLDVSQGAMRFHRLVRRVLLDELRQRDPERHDQLHRRAAHIWLDRGELAEAHLHLSAIGDVRAANEMVVRPTFELIDRGDAAGVSRLLSSMPRIADVDDASLALDLSTASFFGQRRDEAWRWHGLAAALARGDDPAMRLRLEAMAGLLALMDADVEAVARHGDAHHALLGHTAATDPVTAWFPVVSARAALATGQLARAARAIDAARSTALPPTMANVTLPALEAWHRLALGDLRGAVALAGPAHRWATDMDVQLHHGVLDAVVVDGWCSVGRGDLASAATAAESAGEHADRLAFRWNHLRTGALRAEIERLGGRPDRARQLGAALRRSIEPSPGSFAAQVIDCTEAAALIDAGGATHALALIDAVNDGPCRRLLLARATLAGAGGAPIGELLAERHRWPAQYQLEAELLVAAGHDAAGGGADAAVERAMRAGNASGWVSPFLGHLRRVTRLIERVQVEQLHPALHAALHGGRPAKRADTNGSSGGERTLTERELSLLALLPTHLSYAQMGARMYLSVNTVKSNLKSVYRKLGVGSRADAVEAATRAGLL